MCEPTTIIGAIGLATSAIGGMAKAAGEQKEANFTASLLEDQARLVDSASVDARRRGALAAGQVRMAGSQAIAGQRTAAGASGVAVDSGVVQNLAADSRLLSELDALTLENNAAREAWGMDMEAERMRTQAGFTRRSGQAQANATLLGTAGKTADGAVDLYGGYRSMRIRRGAAKGIG